MSNVFSYANRANRRSATANSRQAANEIGAVNTRLHRNAGDIEESIERLSLICEAMWQLIEERTDLEISDLEQRVEELDALDGWRDRRRRRTASSCECGSMVPVAALSCYFCGEPSKPLSLFDTV